MSTPRTAAPPDLHDVLEAARLGALRGRLNALSFTAGLLLFAMSMLAFAALRNAPRPRRFTILGPAVGGVVVIVVGFVGVHVGSAVPLLGSTSPRR